MPAERDKPSRTALSDLFAVALARGIVWMLPQNIGATAKVPALREIEAHHLLVGIAALLQQPTNDVSRGETSCSSSIPHVSHSQIENTAVHLWWRQERDRLCCPELPQSHGSYQPVSQGIGKMIDILWHLGGVTCLEQFDPWFDPDSA
ncbi:hypothetical protein CRV24_003888 [Beauveria bassiana]|nr:hypothetical protein CRV24_003888 [Beauveria bassiana]